jgi:hypothetical protein
MRAVNLLPKDANKSAKSISREDPAVVVGSALGAVVLVALLGGFMNVHGKVNHEQKLIIPVPSVTDEEGPRLTAVSQALGTRIAWDRVLREFSLVLPNDVTVTSVSLQAPSSDPAASTGAPGAAPQGFSIQGSAFSHDGVARLLSRLMLIPDLENVTLGGSTEDTTAGGVTFTIVASIKGAIAPVTAAPVVTTPATTTTEPTS